MIITVAKIGAKVRNIRFDGGSVADVLDLSGDSIEGLEPWLNGRLVPLNRRVKDGDIITLVPIGGIRGEALSKVGGDIWVVHQYDKDCIFPSDCHGHNQVRPEKIDFRTGSIFHAKNKTPIRKYGKKKLQQAIEQLPERIRHKL
jgi:hypothetical protein